MGLPSFRVAMGWPPHVFKLEQWVTRLDRVEGRRSKWASRAPRNCACLASFRGKAVGHNSQLQRLTSFRCIPEALHHLAPASTKMTIVDKLKETVGLGDGTPSAR